MSNLRQELYDRIKASTKDAVILEEMIRLGFWKKDDNAPSIPEQLIVKEAHLVKELRELLEKQRKFQNKEQALKDMRKARMQASKEKQKATKEARKKEKEEKAQKWAAYKNTQIRYLGEDVSQGLNEESQDVTQLTAQGLPAFDSAEALAKAMELSVGELRFLTFNRKVSTVSHYKRFYIAKKSGGKRMISAPMPRLKKAQYWVLDHILNKVSLSEHAHGFVSKKSIVSNALPHLKADILINLDLKDFFPTITFPRIKGVFRKLGYSEQIATLFALLCSEPEAEAVEMDNQTFYTATSVRKLPQGAPTSPAITNILCRRLDKRLSGLAKKYHFTYTRYADDLSFSAHQSEEKNAHKLLSCIRKVLQSENFHLHPDKLKIMRKGARKEVTGIVVNDKPGIKAKEYDKFRALLYQIEKTGTLEGKHWNNSKNLLAAIKGYANFIAMVDPAKGNPLVERANAILKTHGFKHVVVHRPKPINPISLEAGTPGSASSNDLSKEKKPWWKIWKK
jgi:retron-type reverse transcriptase